MATNGIAEIEHIRQLIVEASRRQHLEGVREIFGALEQLEEKHQELLHHREKLEDIEKKLARLTQPPLHHAVFLGPSAFSDGYYVVGLHGERIDVAALSAVQTNGSHTESQKHDGGQTSSEPLDMAQVRIGDEILLAQESKLIVGRIGPQVRGETAEVVNVLRDEEGQVTRLHIKWGGNEGIIVEPTEELRESGVEIGDIVRADTSLKLAYEKLPAYETGELLLEEDPEDNYEDIGGLDHDIEQIKDAIELPFLHGALFQKYDLRRPTGILLYGPPGCGKTMMARAVANGLKTRIQEHYEALRQHLERYQELLSKPPDECLESESEDLHLSQEGLPLTVARACEQLKSELTEAGIDVDEPEAEIERIEAILEEAKSYFLNVKGPELLDKYVGETEHRIRKIFSEARKSAGPYSPVVIFFDEMDAMFQRRGSGISSDVEKTIVPQFLSEIDGFEKLQHVIVIGASNRAEMIDPAILRPGRLDVKIHIGRPDREAARAIFRKYITPELPLAADGIQDVVSWLGEKNFAQVREFIQALAEMGCSLRGANGTQEAEVRLLRDVLTEPLVDAMARRTYQIVQERYGGSCDGEDWPVTWEDVELAIKQEFVSQSPDSQAEFTSSVQATSLQVPMHQLDRLLSLHPLPILSPGSSDFPRPSPAPEILAETFIDRAVEDLFSAHHVIHVRINALCGREFTFPMYDFVSGALIANIVARAKKLAVKREVGASPSEGIRYEDIREAIRLEFEENKEQFASNKPEILGAICGQCRRAHAAEELDILVRVAPTVFDRWTASKRQPYR